MVYQEGQNTIVTNDIEYKLTKVGQNNHTNNYGGGGYYRIKNETTGEAGKFYLIDIELVNQSNEDKEINLTKISLCDKNKTCLRPTRFDVTSVVDIPSKKVINLAPGERKKRTLIFPGPSSFVPRLVLVNLEENKFIEFSYKK